jgi:hypothetical protein
MNGRVETNCFGAFSLLRSPSFKEQGGGALMVTCSQNWLVNLCGRGFGLIRLLRLCNNFGPS